MARIRSSFYLRLRGAARWRRVSKRAVHQHLQAYCFRKPRPNMRWIRDGHPFRTSHSTLIWREPGAGDPPVELVRVS